MVGNTDDYINKDPDAYRREMEMMAVPKVAQLWIPISSRGSTYLKTVAKQLELMAKELDSVARMDVSERHRLREAYGIVRYYHKLINKVPTLETSDDRVTRLR